MRGIVQAIEIVKLTFEGQEVAFAAADRLALADDHGLEDLLSELGLALLD